MKHPANITLILICLFFVAQVAGLFTVNQYIEVGKNTAGGVEISYPDTALGEQPVIEEKDKTMNFIPILMTVLIGTAILFVLIRFKLARVWKFWFFLAIALSLAVSIGVYIKVWWLAILTGIALSAMRVLRPNVFVHNLTELFIYTGITILILPWLNLFAGFVLLIAISIYDIYAVWKSKHMVKLAKFQLESRLFAGLSMNASSPLGEGHSGKGKKEANAILGGGDIAFPLLFSSLVMQNLILMQGIPKADALSLSLIVTLGAGIGLAGLLFYSRKERFYPAMPFISIGCFIGYFAVIALLAV